MNKEYYDAIDKMENAGVESEYIVGWASGYLHNPQREEQRVTDAYSAGYNDGKEKNAGSFNNWLKK